MNMNIDNIGKQVFRSINFQREEISVISSKIPNNIILTFRAEIMIKPRSLHKKQYS